MDVELGRGVMGLWWREAEEEVAVAGRIMKGPGLESEEEVEEFELS